MYLKRFAIFGIPGLALFVFLFLLNKFSWSFDKIDGTSAAILAGMFLILVASVVIVALVLYRDTQRRLREKQQHRDRVQLGVGDIQRQIDDAQRKANEVAEKLSKTKRQSLLQKIADRINSLKAEVSRLEKSAYDAIDAENHTICQDISKQMTQTVTSKLAELAVVVDDEAKNVASANYRTWLTGVIGTGIAISLAAFTTKVSSAVDRKESTGNGTES